MADISLDLTLLYRSTIPGATVQVLNAQTGGSDGNTYNDLLLTLPFAQFTTGVMKSMTILTLNATTKHTILEKEACALWIDRDGKRLYTRTLSHPIGYRSAVNWITEWPDLTSHGMLVVPGDIIHCAVMPASGSSDTGGQYIIDLSIIVLEGASAG